MAVTPKGFVEMGGRDVPVVQGVRGGDLARVIQEGAQVKTPWSGVEWGPAPDGPVAFYPYGGPMPGTIVRPEDVFTGVGDAGTLEDIEAGGAKQAADEAVVDAMEMVEPILPKDNAGGDSGLLVSGWHLPIPHIPENYFGVIGAGIVALGAAVAIAAETFAKTGSVSASVISVVGTLGVFGAGFSLAPVGITLDDGEYHATAADQDAIAIAQMREAFAREIVADYNLYLKSERFNAMSDGPLNPKEVDALNRKISGMPFVWLIALDTLAEAAAGTPSGGISLEYRARRYELILALGLWPRIVSQETVAYLEAMSDTRLDGRMITEPAINPIGIDELFPGFRRAYKEEIGYYPDKETIRSIDANLAKLPPALVQALKEMFLGQDTEFFREEDREHLSNRLKDEHKLALVRWVLGYDAP